MRLLAVLEAFFLMFGISSVFLAIMFALQDAFGFSLAPTNWVSASAYAVFFFAMYSVLSWRKSHHSQKESFNVD